MTGRYDENSGQASAASRLLWFRSDHPDSEVETELVISDGGTVVVRAILRTREAGLTTGHGSANREEDGQGYVEIAEDRALVRALAAFGYSDEQQVESGIEHDGGGTPPIDLVSARSLLRDEQPAPTPEIDDEHAPQPIRQAGSQESNENNGADVNWNKFWNWARPRGYTNARELSELLGVENVLAYTPREVRQMIVRYEMDNPPGGPDE